MITAYLQRQTLPGNLLCCHMPYVHWKKEEKTEKTTTNDSDQLPNQFNLTGTNCEQLIWLSYISTESQVPAKATTGHDHRKPHDFCSQSPCIRKTQPMSCSKSIQRGDSAEGFLEVLQLQNQLCSLADRGTNKMLDTGGLKSM